MWEVIKWIWQLPQHICAIVYLWYLLARKQVIMIERGEHYIVYTKGTLGNITLGKYIFASYIAKENTIKHEIGHTKQSLILGPLYLILIGIPSILWANFHKKLWPGKKYSEFWIEAWADKLGGVK